MITGQPIASVRGLTKSFQAAMALKDVSIDFDPGSIHILFGENGAGKSTLIKLLSGVHQPDRGSILIDGQEVTIASPRNARSLGVSTVFQDPALIAQLTVMENLTLGREPLRGGFLNRKKQIEIAREALDRVNANIDMFALAGDLGRADQQVVEIARALQGSARLLILDEPTAALTEQETERLFAVLRSLREHGIAMIYITHRMGEIRRIGDKISVLRDGALVRTAGVGEVDDKELVTLMTGREVEALFPKIPHLPQPGGLRLEGVTDGAVTDINLHVGRAEIVGIAGLVGSGKGEIAKLCFGLKRLQSGRITVDGKDLKSTSPELCIQQGLIYYPADRKRDGLVDTLSARENVTLPTIGNWLRAVGLINLSLERKDADQVLAKLSLRPHNPEALPSTFSGGNQQKIVLGRGFTRDFRVHIFDEPTAGVDVGARAEIYDAMKRLVESGSSVLVVSSDLPELVNLVHRIYVVAHGRIVGEFTKGQMTEEDLLPYFFHEPHEAA